MKKFFAVLLGLALALNLCACGGAQEGDPQQEGMPNPLTETDEQGLTQATGYSLTAPEGAEDFSYFIIDQGEQPPIGELRFTLDGYSAALRVQATNLLELSFTPEEEEAILQGQAEQIAGDISGLYYDWDQLYPVEVIGRPGYCLLKDDVGFIAWLDVVPGLLYNLSMSEGADQDLLTYLAEAVFVPAQGDV